MPERGRSPRPDDVDALEAVWGREASADAPAVDRLEPASDARPRSWRPHPAVLAAIGGVVVVVAVATAVVVVAEGEDAGRDDRLARPVAAPAPTWSVPTSCPRIPVRGGVGGGVLCDVATDDEQVYVLEATDAVAKEVVAFAVADGEPVWSRSFPDGANGIQRLPSAVVVTGAGGSAVALDPLTGDLRWRAPASTVTALGRDRVLTEDFRRSVDGRAGTTTYSLLDAVTGDPVTEVVDGTGTVHASACPEAELVVTSDGERMTAIDASDGTMRWSVRARSELPSTVRCGADVVAFVEGDRLRVLAAGTGAQVGSTEVPPDRGSVSSAVIDVIGSTVILGSAGGVDGLRADATLEQLWSLECGACGPDLPVAPAGADGEDVVVLLGGEAVRVRGEDTGTRLDLGGLADKVLAAGSVVAWGRGELLVADADGLVPRIRVAMDGVRDVAVGEGHVVVATADDVLVYPVTT